MQCCDPNNFAIGAVVKDKQDNNREAVVLRKNVLGIKSNTLEVRYTDNNQRKIYIGTEICARFCICP